MIKFKLFSICLVLLLILAFGACLNTKTTLKVKKDGSGEIVQTFLFSNAVSEMLNSFSEPTVEGAEPAPDITSQMMDKEKLSSNAEAMGEGVALVSVTPLKEEGFSGYKAIYSFKDINKLKLNQNPSDLMPEEAGSTTTSPDEYITFTFKKGTPATLVITMPEIEKEETTEVSEDATAGDELAMDDSSSEMFKEIYKDMRILIEIELAGTITESNATYKKGAVVTLMDMDFNKILEDEASFDSLVKSKADSLEEMKTIVKNIPGLKFEFQKTVNVKFK